MTSAFWIASNSPLGSLQASAVNRILDWILLLSAIAIVVTLGVIRVRFRRDIPVGSIFVALAVFIVARGAPYLVNVIAPATK